jgi:hypothetical protein
VNCYPFIEADKAGNHNVTRACELLTPHRPVRVSPRRLRLARIPPGGVGGTHRRDDSRIVPIAVGSPHQASDLWLILRDHVPDSDRLEAAQISQGPLS